MEDLEKQWEKIDKYQANLRKVVMKIFKLNRADFLCLHYLSFKDHIKQTTIRAYFNNRYKKIEEDFEKIMRELNVIGVQVGNYLDDKQDAEDRKNRREAYRQARQKKAWHFEVSLNNFLWNISGQGSSLSEEEKVIYGKISKCATRVENLLQKNFLTVSQKEEVDQIEGELQNLETENSEILDLMNEVRTKIALLQNFEVGDNLTTSEEVKEEKNNMPEKNVEIAPSAGNQKMMNIIDEMLPIFTHELSSTKNSTKSYGDGSFATKIFQPFLKSLSSEIFAKNMVMVDKGISWKGIISAYEMRIEDADVPRRHFVGILKKINTPRENTKDLFIDLYETIEIFSRTTFYHRESGTELKTVLGKYDEFLKQDIF